MTSSLNITMLVITFVNSVSKCTSPATVITLQQWCYKATAKVCVFKDKISSKFKDKIIWCIRSIFRCDRKLFPELNWIQILIVFKCTTLQNTYKHILIHNLAFSLFFRELPHSPRNLQVALNETDSRTVLLSWVRPFDGNSPLLRYIIELSENSKCVCYLYELWHIVY